MVGGGSESSTEKFLRRAASLNLTTFYERKPGVEFDERSPCLEEKNLTHDLWDDIPDELSDGIPGDLTDDKRTPDQLLTKQDGPITLAEKIIMLSRRIQNAKNPSRFPCSGKLSANTGIYDWMQKLPTGLFPCDPKEILSELSKNPETKRQRFDEMVAKFDKIKSKQWRRANCPPSPALDFDRLCDPPLKISNLGFQKSPMKKRGKF